MELKRVSFELAKMLKEVRFDVPCKYYIYDEFHNQTILKDKAIDYSKHKKGEKYECIAYPTLELAKQWFREVHKIDINAYMWQGEPTCEVHYFELDQWFTIELEDKDYVFDTYEQALEAGLIEACKLIKK